MGIVMTLMVGFFTSFAAVPAQAVNRHKQVEKTVTKLYNGVKKNDKATVSKYVKIKKNSIVHAFWPSLKKYHTDLKYQVKSVDVTGKKAVVRVKVKYQDLSKVHYKALDRYSDWYKQYYIKNNKKPSNKEVQANYAANFKKALKGYQKKYATKTVRLTLQRKDNDWTAKTLSKNGIDSITGGYQSAYEAYFQ